MNCGLHFLDEGRYREAIGRFRRSAAHLNTLGDMRGQGTAYRGIGDAFMKLGQYNRAIVTYGRCCELAVEAGDVATEASSQARTGECYLHQNLYRLAATSYEESLSLFEQLQDSLGEAGACRGLEKAYAGMHVPQKAEWFRKRARAIESESGTKIAGARDSLDRIRQVIVPPPPAGRAARPLRRATRLCGGPGAAPSPTAAGTARACAPG